MFIEEGTSKEGERAVKGLAETIAGGEEEYIGLPIVFPFFVDT